MPETSHPTDPVPDSRVVDLRPGETTGSPEDDGPLSPLDSWVPPPPDDPLLVGKEQEAKPPKSTGHVEAPILDSPGRSMVGEPLESAAETAAPEVPGFSILGECGRGGMGVVYLAEQVGLRRQVALKFLKPELAASVAQRGRFRMEATALARLQHPNIVQVFDSGTHQGQAYIVQEYVAGGSLDRKLARQPHSARPAAELIATLARAVQHAHTQKILHRDLKPPNVLLTIDGVPKISDFGLAKQLDVETESARTQSGLILGSPSYMAPEQALGKNEEIGPAVDIYALGAILYEMLTGRPPFLAATVIETLEAVRQAEPVRPRQLQGALPRDLETICLKCLAKVPGRRYPSAAALADDVDRFLEGRPILARPASATERLTKWVRRRPATAASVGVASLAAVGLLVGGIAYEGRLRAALEQARANAQVAREQKEHSDTRYRLAREALNKMLARLDDPSLVLTPRVKELKRAQLEDSLGFYREVVKLREDEDPAVRFDVAEAYSQAGYNQNRLDRSAEGREQMTQALSILERLVKEDAARAEYRFALARTCRDLGLSLSQAIRRTAPAEAYAEAEELMRRSVALLEDLVRESPENRDYRCDLADAQNDLGVYFEGYSTTLSGFSPRRNLAECERWFQQAVESGRGIPGPSPSAEDLGFRIRLATYLHNLAEATRQTEHRSEAPRYYAESRQLLTDVLKVEPKNEEALMALGITLLNWGSFSAENPATRAKGEDLMLKAIETLKPLVQREPTWAKPRFFLADCYRLLAEFHHAEGRCAEALHFWEPAIALSESERKEVLRSCQALDLAQLGEHHKAWDVIRSLEPALSSLAQEYYYAHRLLAACSSCIGAAEKDQSLPSAERAALCVKYGDKGADLLRRVLELASVADRPARRKELRENKDMVHLLQRPDVQALLVDPSTPPNSVDAAPKSAGKP